MPVTRQSLFKWRAMPFSKGFIMKYGKYIDEIKKSSSQEPLGLFQPNLAQNILWWRVFKFVQINDYSLFKMGENRENTLTKF